ncbi:MAG: hypothetical protein N2316_07885 [Spirochaetes bacterium]|nr:hypothetical protein [Spirochaetota bacterium]
MKYVIHHHTGHPTEKSHFDFMIEIGDALMTWRISATSIKKLIQGKKVRAARIADHRKMYLSYEGPISCNRGMVNIFDSGECQLISQKSETREYLLKGTMLCGVLRITPHTNNRSTFHYTALS